MSSTWITGETVPYHCPTCDGELFVEEAAPRGGTPCPLCRSPLWFLRTPGVGAVTLTLLPEGKLHGGGGDVGAALLAGLPAEGAVVVDLSRLHALPGNTLAALEAARQEVESLGRRLSLRGVDAGIGPSLAAAGLESLVELPSEQAAAAEPRESLYQSEGLERLQSLLATGESLVPEAAVPV